MSDSEELGEQRPDGHLTSLPHGHGRAGSPGRDPLCTRGLPHRPGRGRGRRAAHHRRAGLAGRHRRRHLRQSRPPHRRPRIAFDQVRVHRQPHRPASQAGSETGITTFGWTATLISRRPTVETIHGKARSRSTSPAARLRTSQSSAYRHRLHARRHRGCGSRPAATSPRRPVMTSSAAPGARTRLTVITNLLLQGHRQPGLRLHADRRHRQLRPGPGPARKDHARRHGVPPLRRGNQGVRRRQLHDIMRHPGYDSMLAARGEGLPGDR